MKEYLKNELKHLPMIVIVSIIFCGINTLANNHLFNSKDVDYDNSNTHIESTNVGDAIDELFDAANNFTTYDTRLQGVESKVGTGTLNTTAQNLIGGVNELNNKLTRQTSNVTTGVSKSIIGKLIVVNLANASLPANGVDLGETIATGSIGYFFACVPAPSGGYVRNDGSKLIYKNGEAVTGVYGTWIGLLA